MPGPGTRIDRFVIERLLGRGGMAEVYAARDTHLRRLVALKLLRSDRDDAAATARLLREARAAASFQHPGAVVVYDVFENDGAAYMAMELVSGRTLRSYIGDASIPIEKRLRWLVDVARALGAAHRAGLVHRDVKPHNVMVSDDGAIKVLDFGIARSHHRSPIVGEDTAQTLGTLTEVGAVIGTPLYASPEQLSAAAVDERSDQFAWGVMGYELCCGLLPWRRRDTLTMLAQLVSGDIPTMLQRIVDAAAAHQEAAAQGLTTRSSPPPPNPALYTEIPEEIEPVLRRAMRREPDERFPTIDDAADMLEEHAEAPLSMRYIPRSALPPSDGLVESLSRTGMTPSAAREDGSHLPSVLTSPRRTAPAATTARNLRELGALAAAGMSMTQVSPATPSPKSLPPSLPPGLPPSLPLPKGRRDLPVSSRRRPARPSRSRARRRCRSPRRARRRAAASPPAAPPPTPRRKGPSPKGRKKKRRGSGARRRRRSLRSRSSGPWPSASRPRGTTGTARGRLPPRRRPARRPPWRACRAHQPRFAAPAARPPAVPPRWRTRRRSSGRRRAYASRSRSVYRGIRRPAPGPRRSPSPSRAAPRRASR